MTRRFLEYVLVAIIACLLAAAIYADLIVRRLDGLAPSAWRILKWEWRVFTFAVAPPSWLAERLGLQSTAYGMALGFNARSPGGLFYNPLPFDAFLEFVRFAAPFWLMTTTITGEAAVFAVRRLSNNEFVRARLTSVWNRRA